MSVSWDNVVSYHGSAMAEIEVSLGFFWFLSILLLLCLPNVKKNLFMKKYQINYLHKKRRTGDCFLRELCFNSWRI